MSLTVYSSSAGSGKTTTLVNEYLGIALKRPEHFKHILAITFTNKAANEMKARVLEVLKTLSSQPHIPDNLRELVVKLNLDNETLKKRAGHLLSLILHNYDDFSISTIDSFIHRIIRTFATDVRLPQNFEVVIDNDDIIPDIINNLYEKVGHDHQLTSLLVDFVMSESDDEQSYDPSSKLIDFIKYQINEDGFLEIKKLDNLSLPQLTDIIKKIRKKITDNKQEVIDSANSVLLLCKENNLEIGDFKNGSRGGFLSYISKVAKFSRNIKDLIPSKTTLKSVENCEFYNQKLEEGKKTTIDRLQNQLTEEFNNIQVSLKKYIYFKLIYRKIYSLALISEIRKLFNEHSNETGKVHISEFNKRISDQISDQPIPFIYERLGRKYRYFLIDEFQDTSILQWQNLLPLIDESLSNGNFNMLVGDAKQAIYRFRNGEVELMASLPKLYNNDGTQISIEREKNLVRNFERKLLQTNWRSYHEIIKFNNGFFKKTLENSTPRNQSIYSDLEQKIPLKNKKDGGLVSLRFTNQDSEDKALAKNNEIGNIIEDLISKGFELNQICILCRTKKRATNIAGSLIENNIDVVSSESLLLTNSPGVRLLVAFLKLVNDFSDEIALSEFVINYISYSDPDLDFNTEINAIRDKKSRDLNYLTGRYNIKYSKEEIGILSVFELCEILYREIRPNDNSDIFIQYFLDFVFDNNLELGKFLRTWEDKKDSLFINMPEETNAVKIMTIHKAKGLDFPIVIVDAEYRGDRKTKAEYWEPAKIQGIDNLKVAMLPINKELELIDRGDIYDNEINKTELDFLNLMYVAFTRPVYALYAIGEDSSSDDKFTRYLMNFLVETGMWDESNTIYDFGELPIPLPQKKTTDDIKLNKFVSSDWTDFVSVARSERAFPDIIKGKSSKAYGNLIHKLMSEITFASQIDMVIGKLSESGIFTNSEIEILEEIIRSIVENKELEELFNSNCRVKNETELLLKDGRTLRPDRIVIENNKVTILDYKTGEEKKEDREQITGYRDALENLGYKNVEAKLVYLNENIRVVTIN